MARDMMEKKSKMHIMLPGGKRWGETKQHRRDAAEDREF